MLSHSYGMTWRDLCAQYIPKLIIEWLKTHLVDLSNSTSAVLVGESTD